MKEYHLKFSVTFVEHKIWKTKIDFNIFKL